MTKVKAHIQNSNTVRCSVYTPDSITYIQSFFDKWRTFIANKLLYEESFSIDEIDTIVYSILQAQIISAYSGKKHTTPQSHLKESGLMGLPYSILPPEMDSFTHHVFLSLAGHCHPTDICLSILDRPEFKSMNTELSNILEKKSLSEILGILYEGFLSSTLIRTQKGKIIMRKKKKGARKRGIYYTPIPIVRYILEKTAKERLFHEDRVSTSRITILDPACGCGIFLSQALECVDQWQNEGKIKGCPPLRTPYRDPSDMENSHLSRTQGDRITSPLDLYGVDLDDQARLMTSMVLALQDTHDLIPFQIKQGNTLVSWLPLDAHIGDFSSRIPELVQLSKNLRADLSYSENPGLKEKIASIKEKLNSKLNQRLKKDFFPDESPDHPFNWQVEFPEVFDPEKNEKEKGFDVVIGNPPWVSYGLRETTRISDEVHEYYCQRFSSAEYKISIYALFIERGISLLRDHGLLGFILPDSFLLGRYFSQVRKYILNTTRIREILLIGEEFWPSGTSGRSVILILEKESDEINRSCNVMKIRCCDTLGDMEEENVTTCSYPQSMFETAHLHRFRLFFDKKSYTLVKKIEENSHALKEFADLYSGCIGLYGQNSIINDQKISLFSVTDRTGTCIYEDTNASHKWKPLLTSGSDIERYVVTGKGKFVYVDPDRKTRRIYTKSGFKVENYTGEKLFVRQTGDSLVAAYDEKGYFCLNNMHVLHLLNQSYDIRYFLAILNSHLMNYYYHITALETGRTLAQTDIETLKELPIRPIDFDDEGEKALYEKIITHTRLLISSKQELHKETLNTNSTIPSRIESDRESIQKVEQDLNAFIYELYGLDGEEIQKIEDQIQRTAPP